MKCFRWARVWEHAHAEQSVCLPSCQVGVQTFPATIKALCGLQSLPCAGENRGRGTGGVLILSAFLWGVLSTNCVFISHFEAFESFPRMSTELRYELEIRGGRKLNSSDTFFPLSTAKWSHLAGVTQISAQLEFGKIEKLVWSIYKLQYCDIWEWASPSQNIWRV